MGRTRAEKRYATCNRLRFYGRAKRRQRISLEAILDSRRAYLKTAEIVTAYPDALYVHVLVEPDKTYARFTLRRAPREYSRILPRWQICTAISRGKYLRQIPDVSLAGMNISSV